MHRSLPVRLIGLLLWMMAFSPVEAAPDSGGSAAAAAPKPILTTP
jgi:hypothetical protein